MLAGALRPAQRESADGELWIVEAVNLCGPQRARADVSHRALDPLVQLGRSERLDEKAEFEQGPHLGRKNDLTLVVPAGRKHERQPVEARSLRR